VRGTGSSLEPIRTIRISAYPLTFRSHITASPVT